MILRPYQSAILARAIKGNTLVVLPTGLGKTAIALALAKLRAKEGSVLFLAPTKPLVLQHFNLFKEHFDSVEILTGETKNRENLARAKILIGTPQTIKLEILRGRLDLKNYALIIFDEAHHAVGEYDYVFIAKQYMRESKNPLILGLTASPGNKLEEIKKNLFIRFVEARRRSDPDVAPYVHNIITKFKFISLDGIIKSIADHLSAAIKIRLERLKQLGLIENIKLNKLNRKLLLSLQSKLQSKIASGDYSVSKALSIIAALLKLEHAYKIVTTESVNGLYEYLKTIWNSSDRIRANKDLKTDFHVRAAYMLADRAITENIVHPKIKELLGCLKKENGKALVFVEYRSSVGPIIRALEQNGFRAHKFIGQASKSEKGMSQKKQKEIIERFRNGEFDVLVCTSVAEEGLDLPEVDLAVFYSPVPSVIRHIQRKGRTGRAKIGKIVFLITKNSIDENYYWAVRAKEKAMENQIFSHEVLEQPKIEEIEKNRDLFIVADSREKKFVHLLYERGAKLKIGNLAVGDFIVGEDVCIERKDIGDFVDSIIDGRLFDQLSLLKQNFENPILLIQGEFEEGLTKRAIAKEAVFGAIASILLDWKVPILVAKNSEQAADIIIALARRAQTEKKVNIPIRHKGSHRTLPAQQRYLIEGLPDVGPVLAQTLLEHFGCPRAIFTASDEELLKIPKLGRKKLEKIKEVLDSKYSAESQ